MTIVQTLTTNVIKLSKRIYYNNKQIKNYPTRLVGTNEHTEH